MPVTRTCKNANMAAARPRYRRPNTTSEEALRAGLGKGGKRPAMQRGADDANLTQPLAEDPKEERHTSTVDERSCMPSQVDQKAEREGASMVQWQAAPLQCFNKLEMATTHCSATEESEFAETSWKRDLGQRMWTQAHCGSRTQEAQRAKPPWVKMSTGMIGAAAAWEHPLPMAKELGNTVRRKPHRLARLAKPPCKICEGCKMQPTARRAQVNAQVAQSSPAQPEQGDHLCKCPVTRRWRNHGQSGHGPCSSPVCSKRV